MTWAIGDIQGCYSSFMKLLEKINFDPKRDRLWLVGDLVNRGSGSLEVLEYVYANRQSINIVLGNHDISLIAAYFGIKKSNPTIEPILSSPNASTLIEWLRKQPFVHMDFKLGYVMAHAGIAPNFELGAAKFYSEVLEEYLQSAHAKEWLQAILSKDSDYFNPKGGLIEQERYIMSSFTRMRYCYSNGHLDFEQKGAPQNVINKELTPWFNAPNAIKKELKIVFGHWSTLGFINRDDILSTDTGCVWGGKLTAVSLQQEQVVQVECAKEAEIG